MRGMRHFLAALLTAALLLSLAACGSTNSAGQLRLYYPAALQKPLPHPRRKFLPAHLHGKT